MKFSELIKGLDIRGVQGPDVEVVDLSCDSREIKPGWAFVALKGEKVDGVSFVPQVAGQGASAIFSESPMEAPTGLAWARLEEGRFTMGRLAKRVHGDPDENLALIGVTGTNGKTTTTTIIRQLLRGAGIGCGLVGTVLNAAGDVEEEAVRTTPESPSFYRWLRRSVEAGDQASAVEVSSIGLDLGRVAGAKFKVGVFTNLTQDHLDFHGTMEAYFESKKRLIAQCDRFLVNADDPYGRALLAEGRFLGYGIEHGADYHATDLDLGPTGTRFALHAPSGIWPVESPLLGRFNAYNLLAALAACAEAGFDIAGLLPAIAGVRGAP
ncbi:MAG TPA: Mur ligase family protein, partial [Holophagaceae bacterium]|nr:Mur ligase family protein [Holophagaceae bacterium]